MHSLLCMIAHFILWSVNFELQVLSYKLFFLVCSLFHLAILLHSKIINWQIISNTNLHWENITCIIVASFRLNCFNKWAITRELYFHYRKNSKTLSHYYIMFVRSTDSLDYPRASWGSKLHARYNEGVVNLVLVSTAVLS